MVGFISLFHVFLFDYSLKSGVAKTFMLFITKRWKMSL